MSYSRPELTPAQVVVAQERAPNLKAALLYLAPAILDQGCPSTRLDWVRYSVELMQVCPDLAVTTDLILESGPWAIHRYTAGGTPVRDWAGLPAGRPFTLTAMDMVRVVDGRIVEYWSVPSFPERSTFL